MTVSPAAPLSAQLQRRLLLICVLSSVILLFIGMQRIVLQAGQLRDFVPITAEVIDRGVRAAEDGKFLPFVAFRFRVGNEVMRTDQLFSRRDPRSRAAAEAAIAPYAVGDSVTAYYDPALPDRTFLRPDLAFGPYVFALMGVALLAVGLALSRWQGRYAIAAEPPPRTRAIAALACAVVWQLGGALAWGHYLHHQPPPYPWAVWVVLPIYGLIGLMPLAVALHFVRMHRARRRMDSA
ncbi:MAG: hypothetical protein AMXMBFR76_22030 [Pseudomonadota bacterium]